MVRRPVVGAHSLKIVGDVNDAYFASLPDGQPFEDGVISLLSRIVQEDWVSIDVGANLGLVSLALAMLASKGRVHAFEPMPRTAAHLRTNLEYNVALNVEVHEVAVGAGGSELLLFDNSEFTAGSLVVNASAPLMRQALEDKPASAFVRVPCTTLDEFVEHRGLDRLDLLKVDAEGFDIDVLRGGKRTLARFQPCVIMEFATFALAMHRNMLPGDALAEVRSTFDRVFVLETHNGWLQEIVTSGDAYEFLSENANQRPVQDLLCTYKASPALQAALEAEQCERRVIELTEQVRYLRSEVDRLRSASWRVTAPLRRIRRLARGD